MRAGEQAETAALVMTMASMVVSFADMMTS